jgi:hypothetical protein
MGVAIPMKTTAVPTQYAALSLMPFLNTPENKATTSSLQLHSFLSLD